MKKLTSLLLTICLLACAAPAGANTGSTVTVTDEAGLLNAIANEGVSTIVLGGSISTIFKSNDNALMIARTNPLTIDGGSNELSLSEGGIVLGADVTLKNLTLHFSNAVRNAIITNGHTLTVNNLVHRSSDYTDMKINIFCGKLTEYNGTNSLPASGGGGGVIVADNSTNLLGDIFAGNLSDVATATNAPSSACTLPASIVIGGGLASGSIGNIYACGAREPRDGTNPSGMAPSTELYPISGRVDISLGSSKAIGGVYGAGGTGGVSLTLSDNSGKGYLNEVFMSSVTALSVESGVFAPTEGSLFSAPPAVSVSSGARLCIYNMADINDTISFASLRGGGTLVMNKSVYTHQKLIISGEVSGTTYINLGNSGSDSVNSSHLPRGDNHEYITAANSSANSFVLHPHSSYPNGALVRDDNGVWTYVENLEPIIVTGVTLPESYTSQPGEYAVEIPMAVTYASGSDADNASLGLLPLDITLNGAEMTPYTSYYHAQADDVSIWLLPTASSDASGGANEALLIECTGADDNSLPVPDGIYTFVITVPESNTPEGIGPITAQVRLTVGTPLILTGLAGDVDNDGKVTIFDAVLAARLALKIPSANALQPAVADIDGDGSISVDDVMAICNLSVGRQSAG